MLAINKRPHGQAVKTRPSQGRIRSSILRGATKQKPEPLARRAKGQFCKNTVYLERGMPYSCFFSSYADLRISSIISRSSFSSGMSIRPAAVK